MLLTQLLRKQGQKVGLLSKPQETLDKGLPLGGRIGGLVHIEDTSFIVANSVGGLVNRVAESASIVAICSYALGGNKTYRYLLDTDPLSYIQVTQQDGKVEEVLYFVQVHRLQPTSIEVFDNLLGEGGLGSAQFNSPMTNPPTAYVRCMGGEDDEYVEPFECTQKCIFDPLGETGFRAAVNLSYYSRLLSDGTPEFMCISMIEPLDVGPGMEGIDTAFVYDLGFPISRNSITII